MAKADKTLNEAAKGEQVIENTPETPKAEAAPKKDTKTEVDLKYGQCIVASVSDQETEILTTISDWNSLYNAGKNAGKFILKAEKKS
jgi:hypothetical protein